jgi:hypothetical protein
MRYSMLILASLIACGCSSLTDKPSMFPNPDKNLRKTNAEFAADAAKRHPYKADAPRGGEAPARAEFDYTSDKFNVINLSSDEWDDVEMWVNQNYVVLIPKMEPNVIKKIDFEMLFDDNGKHFPTDNKKTHVEKVELYRGGKMYDVRAKPVD